jgi:hypothetical protein
MYVRPICVSVPSACPSHLRVYHLRVDAFPPHRRSYEDDILMSDSIDLSMLTFSGENGDIASGDNGDIVNSARDDIGDIGDIGVRPILASDVFDTLFGFSKMAMHSTVTIMTVMQLFNLILAISNTHILHPDAFIMMTTMYLPDFWQMYINNDNKNMTEFVARLMMNNAVGHNILRCTKKGIIRLIVASHTAVQERLAIYPFADSISDIVQVLQVFACEAIYRRKVKRGKMTNWESLSDTERVTAFLMAIINHSTNQVKKALQDDENTAKVFGNSLRSAMSMVGAFCFKEDCKCLHIDLRDSRVSPMMFDINITPQPQPQEQQGEVDVDVGEGDVGEDDEDVDVGEGDVGEDDEDVDVGEGDVDVGEDDEDVDDEQQHKRRKKMEDMLRTVMHQAMCDQRMQDVFTSMVRVELNKRVPFAMQKAVETVMNAEFQAEAEGM